MRTDTDTHDETNSHFSQFSERAQKELWGYETNFVAVQVGQIDGFVISGFLPAASISTKELI